MTSQILNNRLHKEIMVLERDPPPGVNCYPKEDNLTKLEAFIKGPPDTPFEKGLFRLDIQIPNNYPFDPPQIRFVTRIYHPNIDDAGRICADILKKGDKGSWKPSLNLRTTLLSLSQLLANPNPNDPLDAEIAKEYQIDLPTFNQKALEYTLRYANEEAVMASTTNEQKEINVEQKVELKEQSDESEETNGSIVKSKPKLSLSLSKMKNTSNSSQSISSQSSQLSAVIPNSQSLKTNPPESFNLNNSQASIILSSEKSGTLKETKSQVEKCESSQSISSISSQSSLVYVNSQGLKRKHPESFNLNNSQAPILLSSKKLRALKETKPQAEKRESNVAAITRKEPQALDTKMKDQDQIESRIKSQESNVVAITRKKPQSLNTTIKYQDQIESIRSNVDTTDPQAEAKEHIIESKHFPKSTAVPKQTPIKEVCSQQDTKTLLNEIIILSDNEDDGILHSFQLSRKLNRTKISLSRRRK